ncbi:MAG: hypothetical protein U0795_19780 [Pirellulales bacterium]
MSVTLPFLTTYDPLGTSEGTLDPLGLYQIADQLAVQLVPAVRERMQRIRFLTAMAVGALVTEGIDGDPSLRDASPYLVWEWLIVEAIVRSRAEDGATWGVPGTLVTRRALDQHGYLDARSYLKTARIFGFHGVYKRLASHLGLVDVHLSAGPNAELLVDAWARGLGLGGLANAKVLLSRWSAAVRRSLSERPPRTKPNWGMESWSELADAFAPATAKARERRCIREHLLASDERRLGALSRLWQLQTEFSGEQFREEQLHDRLEQVEPAYGPLLAAIRAYEEFARSAQDAFDILRAEGARMDVQGFCVTDISKDEEFAKSVNGLHKRFEAARDALSEVNLTGVSLHNLFDERFGAFAEPMDAGGFARVLCSHHETVQRAKSADGKRPWFDRLGQDRIYVRQAYRIARPEIQMGRYLHDYRGWPIRRFYIDLA